MKLSTILLAIGVGTSTAFEGYLNEKRDYLDALEQNHEHGRELWFHNVYNSKFELYKSIDERCCGEDLDDCKCWVREKPWRWVQRKWEKSCATTIPERWSIGAYVESEEDFSTLTGLLKETKLITTLKTGVDGGYTLFAPNNAAFDALGDVDLTVEQKEDVLLNHVVEGTVTSDQLSDSQVVPTLNGESITIGISDGSVTITTASGSTVNVIATDVTASNGVVHTIDGVLVPSL